MTQTPEEKNAMRKASEEAYPPQTSSMLREVWEAGWQARSEWTPAPSVDVEQRAGEYAQSIPKYKMLVDVCVDNGMMEIYLKTAYLAGSRDLGQME